MHVYTGKNIYNIFVWNRLEQKCSYKQSRDSRAKCQNYAAAILLSRIDRFFSREHEAILITILTNCQNSFSYSPNKQFCAARSAFDFAGMDNFAASSGKASSHLFSLLQHAFSATRMAEKFSSMLPIRRYTFFIHLWNIRRILLPVPYISLYVQCTCTYKMRDESLMKTKK